MIAWLKQCRNWMKRVLAWLGHAYLLWIGLAAIPAVVLLSYVVFANWEARIRIAGMGLDLLGLSTVAFGLRETSGLSDLG